MANNSKLDEAFERFERSLRQLEATLLRRLEGDNALKASAAEADALRRDRSRLAHELDQIRSKATDLVNTNKTAVGKIDAAMSRIRSVLHSNSGG